MKREDGSILRAHCAHRAQGQRVRAVRAQHSAPDRNIEIEKLRRSSGRRVFSAGSRSARLCSPPSDSTDHHNGTIAPGRRRCASARPAGRWHPRAIVVPHLGLLFDRVEHNLQHNIRLHLDSVHLSTSHYSLSEGYVHVSSCRRPLRRLEPGAWSRGAFGGRGQSLADVTRPPRADSLHLPCQNTYVSDLQTWVASPDATTLHQVAIFTQQRAGSTHSQLQYRLIP